MPLSMRAVIIERPGSPVSPNVRFVEDWSEPTARTGEVIVRTEASALNHLDLWVGRGLPGIAFGEPRVSGSDGCGVVEAVGEGVDAGWIGTRVLLNAAVREPSPVHPGCVPNPGAYRMIGEHDPGCHAGCFAAPLLNIVEVGSTDPIEAAAYGLVHLTAWRMLHTLAGVHRGMWALVTGIGGGVAIASLNLCRHFGCRTIVTSRHRWKLDRARELGADECILDTGGDWSPEVRAATGKRGVDVCVDSVGGAIHATCLRSLARGGVLVTCGCTTGSDATTDLARVFWNQLTIHGSTMGDMHEFREATALLRNRSIRPVIDSVHRPEDATTAFERLESGSQFGKIVIDWRA